MVWWPPLFPPKIENPSPAGMPSSPHVKAAGERPTIERSLPRWDGVDSPRTWKEHNPSLSGDKISWEGTMKEATLSNIWDPLLHYFIACPTSPTKTPGFCSSIRMINYDQQHEQTTASFELEKIEKERTKKTRKKEINKERNTEKKKEQKERNNERKKERTK